MSTSTSVVIPTAFRRDSMLRFITSLNAQSELPEELVVADGNPSASDEQAYRERLHPGVRLVYLACELGLTRQRNRGIDAASGEIIFFFDDDVVLETQYLASVKRAFEADQDVGAISGLIVNEPEPSRSKLQRAHHLGRRAIERAFFLMRYRDGRFLPSGMPTWLDGGRTEDTDCECLFGCCMAFRRELVATLRFDERLSRYCYMEDDDIAKRVSQRMRVRYVPDARCQHLHAPANRLTAFAAAKMLMVNHHYLFRKNFPQDAEHRLAHALSLMGYPLLMAWNLNHRRFAGASIGVLSILLRRDPLSALERP
jgi:glucosyl-dolichyl phosphate glucuronosyltransferase